MKTEGRFTPMHDTSLEHEIEAILAVEPSPEFVSRVRTHIAGRLVSGWTVGWTSFAAGSVVVAFVVAVVISKPHEIVQQESLSAAKTGLVRVETSINDVPVSRNLNSAKPPGRRKPTMSRAVARDPKILNNSEDAEPLRDFLANTQLERLELSAMVVKPQPLPEFVFAPLPVLEPMVVLQGDFK